METPVGSAFVTINETEQGIPLEVFINVGKAGSDVAAMAEALGRAISTSLRLRGDLSPKERVKELCLQLSGIGGRRSVGFGQARIRSLPDAVSVALATHFGFKVNGGSTPNILNSNSVSASSSQVKAGASLAAQRASPNGEVQTPQKGPNVDPTVAPAGLQQNENDVAEDTLVEEPLLTKAASVDICPSCGANTLVYEEGCSKCYSCGHSEC